jgi:hypothetical protein
MLPTYQNLGEGESLLVPTATTPEVRESTGMFNKKNTVRVGSAIIIGLFVAAFALRTEIFPSQSVTYEGTGVANSASDAIMKSSSPIFISPESSTLNQDTMMIAPNPLPGVPTTHPDGVTMTAEAPVVAETATTESTESTTPVAEETTAVAAVAVAPATVVVNDPAHPAGAKVKPVMPASEIRSDTRLSPLFMSSYTDKYGLLRTFFSKYGLVGNRLTDKEKYHIPTPIQTNEVKGDASSWAYATMYDSSSCQGTKISVAGLASQQCIPVAGFGGDNSQAFVVDCTASQVVINAYSAQDCSGAVISSSVLASTSTCYQYSSTMYENPTDSPKTDSSTSTSVVFSCGTPNLSGYDVEKMFITADATAQTQCQSSAAGAYDGVMFEAMPTDSCIAESLGDDNEFSVKFSKDASAAPYVTYYFNSLVCSSEKSASADLFTDCETQSVQDGISAYAKWVYHP